MSNELPESLGNIDATFDNLLNDETFIQTKCYEEVLKSENFLIVGRKGVGKSAIARMIPVFEKENWSHIQLAGSPEIYFNDLEKDFSGHDDLKRISSSDFMFQLWEHFILEFCMKKVLKELGKSPYTGDLETIYSYLKSIGQADIDSVASISSYFSSMVELVLPAIQIGGINFSTGSGKKIEAFINARHNYAAAKTCLEKCLMKHNYKILFLIDDIDENLTRNSNRQVVEDFVVQLLNAVTKINYSYLKLVENTETPPLSIKAFIPTDIYSWLVLRHEDKFRSNKYELTWSEDELRAMFRKRLAELCKVGKTPFDKVMKKYFGDHIYDTYGNPRDVFTYMIEHTFGRPRDIMNLYKQLKSVLGGDVSADEAYSAISDYIADTVDTIINEYSFVQPNLRDILHEFEGVDSLCDWEYIRVRVSQKGLLPNVTDSGKVIEILYEISLFGIFIDDVTKQNPPIHSLKVEYCYDRRKKSFKRLPFLMHPVFRYEYSMKDNRKQYLKKLREK